MGQQGGLGRGRERCGLQVVEHLLPFAELLLARRTGIGRVNTTAGLQMYTRQVTQSSIVCSKYCLHALALQHAQAMLCTCHCERSARRDVAALAPRLCVDRYDRAGAVWEIWRPSDTPLLSQYLWQHLGQFVKDGHVLTPDDVSALGVGRGKVVDGWLCCACK